jgi:peptide/nickel transport system permease protein
VTTLLAERLPRTVALGLAALIAAILVGIPVGVAGGSSPNRWWARAVRGLSMILVSVPPLVMSLVLLLVASRAGWLTPTGIRSLVFPTLALGLPIAAALERL